MSLVAGWFNALPWMLATALLAWAVCTARRNAGLSSKTMESKKQPGLYFVGEVMDVTGWLGGFNFQWAWASGHAAGQVV